MENIWNGERLRHEQNEWAQGGTWYTSKWRLERRKLPHPTDSCSLGPLPVQRTDIRTQDPDRRVSPAFETLPCHFLAMRLQLVSKMGKRITLHHPSQVSCDISGIQWI